MSTTPPSAPTDRACLEAWRRHPAAENLQPLLERYGALVYSSAYRRTGHADYAREVTRAVFLVLARRARRLRKKTVLAGWLFHVTSVACRKLAGNARRTARWRWFGRKAKSELPAAAPLWTRVAPEIDAALERLSSAQRDAVLSRVLFNHDWESTARLLGTHERRAKKWVERGLKKLTRRLRRQGVATDAETLAQVCAAEGCAVPSDEPGHPLTPSLSPAPSGGEGARTAGEGAAQGFNTQSIAWANSLPDGLVAGILASIEQTLGKWPTFKLARRTLNALAWARWRRRVVVGVPSFVLLLAMVAGAGWYIDSLTGHSRLISMFFVWSVKHEGKTVPGLAQPARPWPADATSPRLNAAGVRTAPDLYQTTNIWVARLKFAREQWSAVQPSRIDPLPHFFQPDGTVLLRHPAARRSGLAGVLGFDFHWASADFEFGGVAFTNVAARIKGNGTYLGSLYGDKRPFKVDLNKFTKGRKLGVADELTFNNLVNDHSCLSDALAYEFFREAGVPASRTAYAWLDVTVEGRWDRKPLGLYVMVEAVDEEFALERFGSKRTPVFKPVTYELFKHLGDDWSAYDAIYDLKTRATAGQRQRVIEFARLVTFAGDAEFAQRVGEFLDLEKFARYLACEVLLANYDSLLSNGQNFYLYLDPRSNQFGFIPWDLDMAWGGFFLIGTTRERESASIWHPWVGYHRFLERVTAVEAFRKLYRAQLEDVLGRFLVPRRLHQRIDELAKVIRSPLAAESDFRLGKFEDAVSDQRLSPTSGEGELGANRPAHQLKRFIEARAKSVRQQLDGKSNGTILERSAGK